MRAIVITLLISSAAAFGIACGSSSERNAPDGSPGQEHAAGDDSGADGGEGDATPLDGGVDCGYPDVQNDPQCPAAYSYGYMCDPCPSVGLTCAYPGAGDGPGPDGCSATAMLWCKAADAGYLCARDSGAYWIPAQ